MVRTEADVIDVDRLKDGRLVGDVRPRRRPSSRLCPVASAHDSIHAADQYRHILRTVAPALVRSDRKGICSRAGRQSVAGHTAAFEPRERAGVTSHDSGVYPMAADGRANLYGAALYKMYTVDFK